MDAYTFYESLHLLRSFTEVSKNSNYKSLPEQWYIGVTDIRNSTAAIEANAYKSVNILGVSAIIGTLNETNTRELPFSFGGDGCCICFPASQLKKVKNVFRASRQIGLQQFELDLRAAIYPVEYIREQGYDIRVARFMVTEYYSQAVFMGGGLDFAERLLKASDNSSYHLKGRTYADSVDFSGLECRWQEVEPPGKSVLTLLIKSNPNLDKPGKIYDRVIRKLEDIYGFDDKTNPIIASELKMNMSFRELMAETKMRTFGLGTMGRLAYLLKAEVQNILGKIFMAMNYQSSETDWKRYKSDLARQSDHRKFDDMLRLVISGKKKQLKKLKTFLREMHQQSKLAYGIHTSDAAVITCMVFAYHRNHIHFVDGSDGGYVKAAAKLKNQLDQFGWNSD